MSLDTLCGGLGGDRWAQARLWDGATEWEGGRQCGRDVTASMLRDPVDWDETTCDAAYSATQGARWRGDMMSMAKWMFSVLQLGALLATSNKHSTRSPVTVCLSTIYLRSSRLGKKNAPIMHYSVDG